MGKDSDQQSGRPRRRPESASTAMLRARVTPEEAEAVHRLAREQQRSISDIIREAIAALFRAIS